MSNNDYDRACRHLLRRDPPALLGWLLKLKPEQMRFLDWLESRLTEPDRDERI